MRRILWIISWLWLAGHSWAQTDSATATNAPPPPSAAEVAQREFQFGQRFFQAGQFASAAEAFQRAALLQPEFAEAHAQSGAALMQLGRVSTTAQQQLQYYQQATSRFARAAELQPKQKNHWQSWGELLVLLGDMPLEPRLRLACYQGAAEKYQKVTELQPQEWEAYSQWGAVLAYKLPAFAGDDKTKFQLYQSAIELFGKSVERARFSSELGPTYAHWGTALARASRFTTDLEQRKKLLTDSVDKFGRSARAQSGVASTYTLWGTALIELGRLTRLRTDFRDAVSQLSAASALEPNNAATLYTLAVGYTLMGNTAMAVQSLRQCFEADTTRAYFAAAKKDPDFAGLQSEPAFQELFQQTDTRHGIPAYNPPLRDGPR
jgi:tetratricopeptide (TPR) repeat protein